MNHSQRGFALLIVLWTMGVLALLAMQLVATGRSDNRLTDALRQQAMLEAAADGAIQKSVFLLLAARDRSLRADGATRTLLIDQIPVLIRIENESDRINLNTASAALLRSLVVEVGGTPNQADRLAAAILDWRTAGLAPRRGGAKAAEYRAAGRNYGPPGTPFQAVDELADVAGMTADLLARMAPHLTVLSDSYPEASTRDPVVAGALADAAAEENQVRASAQGSDGPLRISVTAVGPRGARFAVEVVASAAFQSDTPRVNILLRERIAPFGDDTMRLSGVSARPST